METERRDRARGKTGIECLVPSAPSKRKQASASGSRVTPYGRYSATGHAAERMRLNKSDFHKRGCATRTSSEDRFRVNQDAKSVYRIAPDMQTRPDLQNDKRSFGRMTELCCLTELKCPLASSRQRLVPPKN